MRGERKDGGAAWTFQNASLLADETAGEVIVEGTVADITERRQLEEQLRQSQKMEGIGQLAGGIAHDFNNLLTTVLGYSDMALSQLSADDPIREDIDEIRKAGQRASNLTRQLLAFSRKQVFEPRVARPERPHRRVEPHARAPDRRAHPLRDACSTRRSAACAPTPARSSRSS